VKYTTSRWTELLRAIAGETFRTDGQIEIPARLSLITELGGICQGVLSPPSNAVMQESWVLDNTITQIGLQAQVNNFFASLAPGAWRIRGHATVAGVIALGSPSWSFSLNDPSPTAFGLAKWISVPGIQFAQRFPIDMPIAIAKPWQFQHFAPATAAGDFLLAHVSVQAVRLL